MRSPLVMTSIGIHVVVVAGLFVAGFWTLERLEPARRTVDIAVMSPPPPAPSGSPAAGAAEAFKKKRRRVATDVVQPAKPDHDAKTVSAAGSGETGSGGTGTGPGTGSGSDPEGTGSCPTPPCGDAAPATAPTPGPRPVVVPPHVIKGLRIAGETQIVPPPPVKIAMARDGRQHVVAVVRVCVGEHGEISSLSILKSSGYPAYDAALEGAMSGWRYRPYIVNGKPVAVCGVVTFIYSIQ